MLSCLFPPKKNSNKKVYPSPIDLASGNADKLTFKLPNCTDDYLDPEQNEDIFAQIRKVDEASSTLLLDIESHTQKAPVEFIKHLHKEIKRGHANRQVQPKNNNAHSQEMIQITVDDMVPSTKQDEEKEHCLVTYSKHLLDLIKNIKFEYSSLIELTKAKQKEQLQTQLNCEGMMDLLVGFQVAIIKVKKSVREALKNGNLKQERAISDIKSTLFINHHYISEFKSYLNYLSKNYSLDAPTSNPVNPNSNTLNLGYISS